MPSLASGKLIKRYKRFLVDIDMGDDVVTAHCPNSGSMKGLIDPGTPVWISKSLNIKRKLPYTLEIVKAGGAMVGVNTQRPNQIVKNALQKKYISQLSDYNTILSEVRYGQNSRIDLLLKEKGLPDAYVEVKNVTLKEGDSALFPDAVTARGTKHLRELIEVCKSGKRAIMFYLVQRQDCTSFGIASEIDPIYAKTFNEAVKKGVEFFAYPCEVNPSSITINHKNPLTFINKEI